MSVYDGRPTPVVDMKKAVDREMDEEVKRAVSAYSSRYGSGRPRLDLLPIAGLEEAAAAFEFGTIKYKINDWLENNLSHRDQARAAVSHIYKYLSNENVDPESGVEHLGHAAARILILLTLRRKGLGKDDR